MRRHSLYLAALLAGALGLAGAAPSAVPSAPTGVWSNPKNSVHVRMQSCGDSVCGTVVWANERAKRKALEGGTERMVGAQLFREFRQVGPASWSGRVFVPDMGKTFSGKLTALDAETIQGRGCLIGGFLCKTQTWKRIG